MTLGRWEIDVPTLNDKPPLNANQRLHWAEKARRVALVRDAVGFRAKGVIPPRRTPVAVHLRWHVTDRRRRDPSNLMPTQKAALDGLVQAGVLVDDSPQYVTEGMPMIEHWSGPRLFLVVEEVAPEAWPDNLPEVTRNG